MRVKDLRSEAPTVESVPIMKDFLQVFPDDLPRISLKWEIDFGIYLWPETQPISNPPYRMALAELREFKAKLKDFLDKGFINQAYPHGALR